MEVDHIIIFSNNQDNEADELVNFGLTEGSNRIHHSHSFNKQKFQPKVRRIVDQSFC